MQGSVSFSEFVSTINRTEPHQQIPFKLEGSFIQQYFGAGHDREVRYREFSQFLHDYHRTEPPFISMTDQ